MTDREIRPWQLIYHGWDPNQQPLREALCTLGNGYFATRGAAEEAMPGGSHYPGTYLAGGFNRLESEVAGRIIENEDLVNWPNWICLTFRTEDDPDWFDIARVDVLHFRQSLDVRCGMLERAIRFRHAGDRETTLISRRLVHMGDPHLAAIQWKLTPENWSGTIHIRTALDGAVINHGVPRYRQLNSHHLEVVGTDRVGEDGLLLSVESTQSRIRMTQGARTQIFCGEDCASVDRQTNQAGGEIEQLITVDCQREKPLRIEKIAAIYTSRDHAISEPSIAACKAVTRAGSFQELFASHQLAWHRLWTHADMDVNGRRDYEQFILRLHIFHLLQTTSLNSIDRDVGVPARGLHGEAYRGHIFWDELFIFPFLNMRIPELSRSLLMYRYRRLEEACHAAQAAGYQGAMYPWQSGSDGREESQVLHLNPKSGRWVPDHTYRQRHIGAAVAYNVWQYYQASGDMEFLTFYGAKMLLQIARFWASITVYHAKRGRFEIHGVVGPDEFHTSYPDSDDPGLSNNAYTNVMAAWVLQTARKVFELLGDDRRAELIEELKITDEELMRWEEISQKMFVPFHGDGIISQFEGYEQLQELDWEAYRLQYEDIHRLDRILESEGDSADRYQVSKQADVIMLFYLFSAEELVDLLQGLGYVFDATHIPKILRYYMERTSHGSTLSRVVHSWVLARSDREHSWRLFRDALASDVDDVQGGTTAEGIHLGAMAGTVDLVQRCFTGMEVRDDILWLNPCLPEDISPLRLRLRYRGHWLRLEVTQKSLELKLERCWSPPIRVGVCGRVYVCHQGDRRSWEL